MSTQTLEKCDVCKENEAETSETGIAVCDCCEEEFEELKKGENDE